MKIYKNFDLIKKHKSSIILIGNFDGVHLGHRKLFDLARKYKKKFKLDKLNVGILGMSFKANIDDIRDSLSFKLRKQLEFKSCKVLCSDYFIKDPKYVSEKELIKKSKVIIIAIPHDKYKKIKFPKNKYVINLWF